MHSPNPHSRSTVSAGRALAVILVTTVALAACSLSGNTDAESGPGPISTDGSISGHGAVAGATEMPEPQLGLVSIDTAGEIAMINLLTGDAAEPGVVSNLEAALPVGADASAGAVTTDGRYLFVTGSSEEGVTIVDSGAWTVPHGDHFHYYQGTPRVVGTVAGAGRALVASGPSRVSLWFSETGTGVVLDAHALGLGTISEVARIRTTPHTGALVPLGDRLLGTVATEAGESVAVQLYDAEGVEVADAGSRADCREFSGTITTNVGVVFGCADGALLVTEPEAGTAGAPAFERIPYPAGTARADRAVSFDGRIGRPTVAAVAGTSGLWLLNTRDRRFTLVPTDTPLLLASAVSDSAGLVVAVDVDGRIRVLDPATGDTVSSTEPLLAASLSRREMRDGVSVQVDASRAYVNAAADGVVYEIDFADGARIARTFTTATAPVYFAEIGR